MPIARQKLLPPQAIEPELPKIQPDGYSGVVADNNDFPVASLLPYVEGAPWTVQYYGQIVGKHSDLRDFDPSQSELYQQYRLIKDLELRVSSPLTNAFISETSIMKVNGGGYLPTCVTPNVGDVFVAIVDGGDAAMFRVTNIERKSFNRTSVHYIEYEVTTLVHQHPERLDAINAKVQQTYYFHKDRLVDGLEPLVTTEDNESILKSRSFYRDLVRWYFRTFYNQRYSTLVLPYQDVSYYDPFLVRFLMKIVNSDDAPEIRYINNLPTQKLEVFKQPTIWDALINQSMPDLEMSNKRMGFISTNVFFRDPNVEYARYQLMSFILAPLDTDDSLRVRVDPEYVEATIETLRQTTGHHGIEDLTYNAYTLENAVVDILPPLFENQYYVFSQRFYEDSVGKALLETMTLQYLNKETLDLNKIVKISERWSRWSRMEQFYYSPVLMALIKGTLGGVSV